MSSNEVLISVSNLAKCFHIYEKPSDRLLQMLISSKRGREFWAVNDVSLEVRRGEALAIIGKNGSGKSTLLQMICGTLEPTKGTVQRNGRVAALLELGAGFNPEYTGRENVVFSASLYGLSEQQITERLDSILQFADIGDFIDQPVKTYSSGMFVRLAFALIAHVDADILVVDEALAVGDVFFTQKCMRFIRDFVKKGALLFVSHDTNSVMSFCREAIWLDAGHVKVAGDAKTVCEKYLEDYYALLKTTNTQTMQQHKSAELELGDVAQSLEFKDCRRDFVIQSNLRTEYEINLFDGAASSFGVGGGEVLNVYFSSADGSAFSWLIGGEKVSLTIVAKAYTDVARPIIGFVVRNKNGLHLFGDNTCIYSLEKGWMRVIQGETLESKFTFIMPRLPAGEYVISVAFADGTQEEHMVLHWLHDAIVFKSHSPSVSAGLVGIPMLIEMR